MNYFFQYWNDEEYYIFYRLIIFFYVVFGTLILLFLEKKTHRAKAEEKNILKSFIIFIILFAGTRSLNVGTDTINYYQYFFVPASNTNNLLDIFNVLNTDWLFELLIFLTIIFKSFTFFLLIVSLVMNIAFYRFSIIYTNNLKNGSPLLFVLTIACSLSFLNLEINIIRNGLAIPFILFGLYYFSVRNNYTLGLIYLTIAYFFHNTSLIPISIIFFIFLFKKIPLRYYLLLYFLAIVLSYVGFGFHSISFLQNSNITELTKLGIGNTFGYRTGFRIDFVIYNTIFLIIFTLINNSKNGPISFILKYYIISSVIFFLNFYIPFSDRIGQYSWMVIPLLLFSLFSDSSKFYFKFNYFGVLLLFFILNHILIAV